MGVTPLSRSRCDSHHKNALFARGLAMIVAKKRNDAKKAGTAFL
jgi:hypothetical protein